MSKLGDRRGRHDPYWKKAKDSGAAARAIFKLEEIDRKVKLLGPGARVLDLGCAPGSWLQYAARVVGDAGALVGIDRNPLTVSIPKARILQGDIYQVTPETLRGELVRKGIARAKQLSWESTASRTLAVLGEVA